MSSKTDAVNCGPAINLGLGLVEVNSCVCQCQADWGMFQKEEANGGSVGRNSFRNQWVASLNP